MGPSDVFLWLRVGNFASLAKGAVGSMTPTMRRGTSPSSPRSLDGDVRSRRCPDGISTLWGAGRMQFQPEHSQARAWPGSCPADHSPRWNAGILDEPHRGGRTNQAGRNLPVLSRLRRCATTAWRATTGVPARRRFSPHQRQRNHELSQASRHRFGGTDGGSVDGKLRVPRAGATYRDRSTATGRCLLVRSVSLVPHAYAGKLISYLKVGRSIRSDGFSPALST